MSLTFRSPKRQIEDGSGGEAARVTSGGLPRERSAPLRALVVDPDPTVLAFAADALNSFRPGFDVATAESVDKALAWLDTFQPDVLLLGIYPASEGVEALIARLGNPPRTTPCKIVCLTESAPSAFLLAPARIRAQAVLPKPLGLTTLLSTVRRLVQE